MDIRGSGDEGSRGPHSVTRSSSHVGPGGVLIAMHMFDIFPPNPSTFLASCSMVGGARRAAVVGTL
jgi:hypothetical protein